MTVLEAIMGWAAAPLLGWGWSVETRLAKLAAIEKNTDRIDARVEKIYDHLLGDGSPSTTDRKSQADSK